MFILLFLTLADFPASASSGEVVQMILSLVGLELISISVSVSLVRPGKRVKCAFILLAIWASWSTLPFLVPVLFPIIVPITVLLAIIQPYLILITKKLKKTPTSAGNR